MNLMIKGAARIFFTGMTVVLSAICVWLADPSSVAAQENSAMQATVGSAGNDSYHSANQQSSPSLQRRDRYRLEPGDIVDLTFPLSPEFNQTVTIAPDGYIALRSVGDFMAKGKTLPELAAGLRTTYSSILHDPVVTVDLKDFQKPYFTVGGEVGHPGKYELRDNTTVTEAIAIAGGFTPNSKHSQVLMFRRISDGSMVEVKKFDLKKMLSSTNTQENIFLQPTDMLFVPKNMISKIERFLPTESMGLYTKSLP